jgi:hypothetical protein
MTTETHWETTAFDEATAILEAEWMRLEQDVALWEREVADLFADELLPQSCPARVGVFSDTSRSALPPVPDRTEHGCARRQAMPVWPTQRSPPPRRAMPAESAERRR